MTGEFEQQGSQEQASQRKASRPRATGQNKEKAKENAPYTPEPGFITSMEEAQHVCYRDSSGPVSREYYLSEATQAEWRRRLYKAMINLTDANDENSKAFVKFKDRSFSQAEIEAVAWITVDRVISHHKDGFPLPSWLNTAKGKPDNELKIVPRLQALEHLLHKEKLACKEMMEIVKIALIVNEPSAALAKKADNRAGNRRKQIILAQAKQAENDRAAAAGGVAGASNNGGNASRSKTTSKATSSGGAALTGGGSTGMKRAREEDTPAGPSPKRSRNSAQPPAGAIENHRLRSMGLPFPINHGGSSTEAGPSGTRRALPLNTPTSQSCAVPRVLGYGNPSDAMGSANYPGIVPSTSSNATEGSVSGHLVPGTTENPVSFPTPVADITGPTSQKTLLDIGDSETLTEKQNLFDPRFSIANDSEFSSEWDSSVINDPSSNFFKEGNISDSKYDPLLLGDESAPGQSNGTAGNDLTLEQCLAGYGDKGWPNQKPGEDLAELHGDTLAGFNYDVGSSNSFPVGGTTGTQPQLAIDPSLIEKPTQLGTHSQIPHNGSGSQMDYRNNTAGGPALGHGSYMVFPLQSPHPQSHQSGSSLQLGYNPGNGAMEGTGSDDGSYTGPTQPAQHSQFPHNGGLPQQAYGRNLMGQAIVNEQMRAALMSQSGGLKSPDPMWGAQSSNSRQKRMPIGPKHLHLQRGHPSRPSVTSNPRTQEAQFGLQGQSLQSPYGLHQGQLGSPVPPGYLPVGTAPASIVLRGQGFLPFQGSPAAVNYIQIPQPGVRQGQSNNQSPSQKSGGLSGSGLFAVLDDDPQETSDLSTDYNSSTGYNNRLPYYSGPVSGSFNLCVGPGLDNDAMNTPNSDTMPHSAASFCDTAEPGDGDCTFDLLDGTAGWADELGN